MTQQSRNFSMQAAEWGLDPMHLIVDHDTKYTRQSKPKPKAKSEKDKAAKPKPDRSGVVTQAYLDPEIRAALDGYISHHNAENDHKATITSTIEAALRRYLTTAGFWPPKTPTE